MKKFSLSIILLMFLTGCKSVYEKPVGIGTGRDDLKRSPCACQEFYDYEKGGYI